MRFLVISDIHGSEASLRKVLAVFKRGNFNKILICGDILYHGARNPLPEGYNPKKVVEILNNIKEDLIVVRGNCESEVDSMVMDFPVTGDYSYIYCGELEVFMSHGHKFKPENCNFLKEGALFLSGHTHIPKAEKAGKIFNLNPGSISLPKDDWKPSYGILTPDSWQVKGLNDDEILISIDIPTNH